MSTRSVIGRKTASGFTGVYHHWDGYPSGLGAQLFEVFNGYFKRDMPAMLKYLIDDHPAGWSTIVGADFTIAPGQRKRDEGPCALCGCPNWMHYTQYYASHNLPTPPSFNGTSAHVFNHGYKESETPQGPECYPDREACIMDEASASGSGCEWAYVFAGKSTMEIYSSYHPTGGKMIGMFGCGNPDARWYLIASVDLTAAEPNWKQIESMEPVQPVLN